MAQSYEDQRIDRLCENTAELLQADALPGVVVTSCLNRSQSDFSALHDLSLTEIHSASTSRVAWSSSATAAGKQIVYY